MPFDHLKDWYVKGKRGWMGLLSIPDFVLVLFCTKKEKKRGLNQKFDQKKLLTKILSLLYPAGSWSHY